MKRTYKTTAYPNMFTYTEKLYKKCTIYSCFIAIYVARTLVRTLLPETEYLYNIDRVGDYK